MQDGNINNQIVCVSPCGSACPMKCFFFSISSGWLKEMDDKC
jgi:hypothetical protein